MTLITINQKAHVHGWLQPLSWFIWPRISFRLRYFFILLLNSTFYMFFLWNFLNLKTSKYFGRCNFLYFSVFFLPSKALNLKVIVISKIYSEIVDEICYNSFQLIHLEFKWNVSELVQINVKLISGFLALNNFPVNKLNNK